MAKALYHTFGCKLNFAETATVATRWEGYGISAASKDETPDMIFINSCSVTEEADKKCRQAIRRFHRLYPEAAIILTGCYATLKPAQAALLPGVVAVVPNSDKANIDQALFSCQSMKRKGAPASGGGAAADGTVVFDSAEGSNGSDLTDGSPGAKTPPASGRNLTFSPSCARGDRTRYFLKVQDGCDCWCTYCTIPAARGVSRSATIAQLVHQARQAAAEGGKEIVLTGVNIGDFGKRQPELPAGAPRESFFDLIRALDRVEGIERYRISSLEPDLLSDEIISFCASSSKFMPHFHIPLQSGSDPVLKLMHRHYDIALFRDKILKIKEYMPQAFIGVDLIVGARGETEEEFQRSVEFVESLPITRLHIFPYSERPGTKALNIEHIVSQEEKHRRMKVMTEISDRKLRRFAEQFVGSVHDVLPEHSAKGGAMSGFTDNYLKVRLPEASPCFDNRIIPVKLISIISTPSNELEFLGEVITDKK